MYGSVARYGPQVSCQRRWLRFSEISYFPLLRDKFHKCRKPTRFRHGAVRTSRHFLIVHVSAKIFDPGIVARSKISRQKTETILLLGNYWETFVHRRIARAFFHKGTRKQPTRRSNGSRQKGSRVRRKLIQK